MVVISPIFVVFYVLKCRNTWIKVLKKVSFCTAKASQVININLLLLVITLSKQHHRVPAALQLFILQYIHPMYHWLHVKPSYIDLYILPPCCSFSNWSNDSVSLQWSVMNSRCSERERGRRWGGINCEREGVGSKETICFTILNGFISLVCWTGERWK